MIRKLLLALVSLSLACAALEVVLRATHLFGARLSWTEPDADIGFRFTPGRRYWFRGENDHAITGTINAQGWRDREREREKGAGVFRAAVIGDSFVEAFQVELDSTFPAIAERALNAGPAAPRFEVMNFGRSGASPVEANLVLERDVLPLAPDLVVFVFTPGNDVSDVNPATATGGMRPFARIAGDSVVFERGFVSTRGFRMRVWINPVKQHSVLVSLITERYNAWRRARGPAGGPDGGAGLSRLERLCTASPDVVFAGNYSLCKKLIGRMSEVCRRRGVAFAVMAVPLPYDRAAEDRKREVDGTFRPDFFDDDLAAMADSSGFHFAPLTRAFAARRDADGEDLYWAHWNYAGHREAAAALIGLVEDAARAPLGRP